MFSAYLFRASNLHWFFINVRRISGTPDHVKKQFELYTLRKKHSNTKIIDIAIFEGSSPERSSKFYKFINNENNSVEKISNEILKLLEDQKLSESEKGEVVLKVLRKIMNFKNNDKEKLLFFLELID